MHCLDNIHVVGRSHIVLDLRKKSTLTRSEALWLCSAMQSVMLDETFRIMKWTAADAVFHGGTSIHLAWGSPRFSEDLDFMVADEALDCLAAAAPDVFSAIEKRVRLLLPKSSLAMKSSTEKPGRDRMDTWDLRWSHDMRQGVAKVKGEFYSVRPELLEDYRSRTIQTLPGSRTAIRIGNAIPVAELVSLWGDKVKAISSRPEFKMRDAHDLGFIARQFEASGRPPDEELLNAVTLSGRLYGRSRSQTADGVQLRLEDGTMDRLDDFIVDMSRWFEPDLFETMQASGALDDLWSRTRAELEFAKGLLMDHPVPGPFP